MASAAITVVENPATIESDTNEATITKDTNLPNMAGELRNHGPSDVWLSVAMKGDAADSVVTTGAQAQRQIPLPAGAAVPWLWHYTSVKHKTAAGASTLSWTPDHLARRT